MLAACEAAYRAAHADLDFIRINKTAFEKCRSDSIDYAVMEKTKDAVVVPLDAGWSDVGSWSSLFDALPADSAGNVQHGDVIAHDSHGCYLHSSSRLVATVGLKDHVVVETKDAVLVAPKDRVQDVKALVDAVKKSGRTEHLLHREVFRPWGSYDSIDFGDRFQVKRLMVKPGGVLSLQMHHHRAEHWIVVSGTARITCDDKVFLLSENESTYIPVGSKHRIENPGKVPVHIVEVQSGSYLGEDDIVRFEDNYGRQGTNT
jgi:mannose-1-phosphate guanylyltransferase/mannose-6-phosphate isomerase